MKKGISFAIAAFFAASVIVFPAYAFKSAKTEVKAKPAEAELPKAPKFPKGTWLNSQPLDQKIFKDKATLIYFWDYSSINCIREMETIKSWEKIYRDQGFQVIWVHAPEFKLAGQPELVRKAAARFGITQPIFLDNDFKMWDAYGVRSWPTKVLINKEGKIAADFVGEENLFKTESKIRLLLKKIKAKTVLPARLVNKQQDLYGEYCGVMSGETYVGYKRSDWWGASLANQKWVPRDKPMLFKDRGQRVERGFFLNGLWESKEDDVTHVRNTNELTDYLGLVYMGREVYTMVNHEEAGNVPAPRVYVTRDNGPVPAEMRGTDLKEDEEGKTYFNIDGPRLYSLITNEDQDPHELRLWIQSPGISVHSFAFSNQCLSEFEHPKAISGSAIGL
jgi:thiol-disulfide isomerase/thioredoxin